MKGKMKKKYSTKPLSETRKEEELLYQTSWRLEKKKQKKKKKKKKKKDCQLERPSQIGKFLE